MHAHIYGICMMAKESIRVIVIASRKEKKSIRAVKDRCRRKIKPP
jgi:hypothetical protein